MAANAGVITDRFYDLTIVENVTEIRGYWYRVQIEQSNFREVVYTLASIYSDPNKGTLSRQQLWPIEAVDKDIQEDAEDWAKKAKQLLEANKKRKKNG